MKLTTMGVMRMACPIEMARGVKRSPNIPNGPDLDKSRKRTRPSTTVGIPRNALNDARMKRLPGKFFKPKITATGRLHMVAITVASPDTYRLRSTMLYSVGSRENSSWKAFRMPSTISLVKKDSLV
jgi:hypothetical protein